MLWYGSSGAVPLVVAIVVALTGIVAQDQGFNGYTHTYVLEGTDVLLSVTHTAASPSQRLTACAVEELPTGGSRRVAWKDSDNPAELLRALNLRDAAGRRTALLYTQAALQADGTPGRRLDLPTWGAALYLPSDFSVSAVATSGAVVAAAVGRVAVVSSDPVDVAALTSPETGPLDAPLSIGTATFGAATRAFLVVLRTDAQPSQAVTTLAALPADDPAVVAVDPASGVVVVAFATGSVAAFNATSGTPTAALPAVWTASVCSVAAMSFASGAVVLSCASNQVVALRVDTGAQVSSWATASVAVLSPAPSSAATVGVLFVDDGLPPFVFANRTVSPDEATAPGASVGVVMALLNPATGDVPWAQARVGDAACTPAAVATAGDAFVVAVSTCQFNAAAAVATPGDYVVAAYNSASAALDLVWVTGSNDDVAVRQLSAAALPGVPPRAAVTAVLMPVGGVQHVAHVTLPHLFAAPDAWWLPPLPDPFVFAPLPAAVADDAATTLWVCAAAECDGGATTASHAYSLSPAPPGTATVWQPQVDDVPAARTCDVAYTLAAAAAAASAAGCSATGRTVSLRVTRGWFAGASPAAAAGAVSGQQPLEFTTAAQCGLSPDCQYSVAPVGGVVASVNATHPGWHDVVVTVPPGALLGAADGPAHTQLSATGGGLPFANPVTLTWTLDTTAPVVNVTTPPPLVFRSAAALLTATATDAHGGVATVQASGGAVVIGGGSSSSSSSSSGVAPPLYRLFQVQLPTAGGEHAVTITAIDAVGNAAAVVVDVVVDDEPPTAQPSVASVLANTRNVTVSCQCHDNVACASVTMQATPHPTCLFASVVGGQAVASPTAVNTYERQLPLAPCAYTLTCTPRDVAGNVGVARSFDVTVDTVAPAVRWPVDLPPRVAVPSRTASVLLLLSDASPVVAVTPQVFPPWTTRLNVTVAVVPNGAQLTASAPTDGCATMGVSVEDGAGNVATSDRNVSLCFDTTPPESVGVTVANHAGTADGTPVLGTSPTLALNLTCFDAMAPACSFPLVNLTTVPGGGGGGGGHTTACECLCVGGQLFVGQGTELSVPVAAWTHVSATPELRLPPAATLRDGLYEVVVTFADDVGNVVSSSTPLLLDQTAPVAPAVSSPGLVGGVVATSSATFLVTLTHVAKDATADADASPGGVDFHYTLAVGGRPPPAGVTTSLTVLSATVVEAVLGGLVPGDYLLSVWAEDQAGNVGDTTATPFQVVTDVAALTVGVAPPAAYALAAAVVVFDSTTPTAVELQLLADDAGAAASTSAPGFAPAPCLHAITDTASLTPDAASLLAALAASPAGDAYPALAAASPTTVAAVRVAAAAALSATVPAARVAQQCRVLVDTGVAGGVRLVARGRASPSSPAGDAVEVRWAHVTCNDVHMASIAPANGSVACVPCPPGADCVGAHVTVANVGALPGWWTSASATYYPCPVAEACVGANGSQPAVCAPQYDGLLCSRCAAGHFSQFGVCSPCPESPATVIGVAAAALVVAVVLGAVLVRYRQLLPMPLLRVAVTTAQIMAALTTGFSIPWPSTFQHYLSALQVVLLDVVSATRASCASQQSLYSRFVVTAAVAGALGATALAVAVARQHRAKRLRVCVSLWAGLDGHALFRGVFLVLTLAYPGLSRFAVEVFRCTTIDGTPRLRADLSLVCYDAAWTPYAVASVVVLVVLTAGLPVGTFVYLWRHRHRLATAAARANLGWLYESYGEQAYFWEVAELVRKLLLTVAVLALSTQPAVQVAAAVAVSAAFHTLHAAYQPFLAREAYYLQHAALGVTTGVLLLGLLFQVRGFDADAGGWGAALVTAVTALLVAFAVVVAVRMAVNARGYRDKRRRSRVRRAVGANGPMAGGSSGAVAVRAAAVGPAPPAATRDSPDHDGGAVADGRLLELVARRSSRSPDGLTVNPAFQLQEAAPAQPPRVAVPRTLRAAALATQASSKGKAGDAARRGGVLARRSAGGGDGGVVVTTNPHLDPFAPGGAVVSPSQSVSADADDFGATYTQRQRTSLLYTRASPRRLLGSMSSTRGAAYVTTAAAAAATSNGAGGSDVLSGHGVRLPAPPRSSARSSRSSRSSRMGRRSRSRSGTRRPSTAGLMHDALQPSS